jgi:hypothetical protein
MNVLTVHLIQEDDLGFIFFGGVGGGGVRCILEADYSYFADFKP